MATKRQTAASKKNIQKAASAAKAGKTISHLPKKTRTALGKKGAAAAAAKRKK
jgi:ABC-type protease/lipase transport system fused ATPase/permease subunit